MKTIDAAYQAFIDSSRVSSKTREVLLERAKPDDPAYEPQVLSVDELTILRAITDRLVPQAGNDQIDLAARIDKTLAEGKGKGWRFALLPPDPEAYRSGVRTFDEQAKRLYAKGFCGLPAAQQDALLRDAAMGSINTLEKSESGRDDLFTAEQLRLWFEELRGAAVAQYVAHPATLARIGYSGIGDGSSAAALSGFVRLGPGEREDWEPIAHPAVKI